MDTAMATAKKARQASERRYPLTSLGTEEESPEYWLSGYNHSVFKVMARIDENVTAIKDGIEGEGGINDRLDGIDGRLDGIDGRINSIDGKLDALIELVKDGFSTLGVNISNGDHRVGRPIR
jgi:hypothetical protein